MTAMIDMDTIYREERERWLREEAPRKSIREIVALTVPYWIVLVALVLYGLSAPHTAGVFDKLTPGWGFIAPIGVEFGLLYAAFRRRFAKERQQTLPWTLWALEVLLFVTAMLVNGTGSFTSVVTVTHLDDLSFSAMTEQFGHLPATSQAALVMAGLAAFIIPIGTLVAGEGLAAIVLERQIGTDLREVRWREAEFTVTYRRAFVAYRNQGLADLEAKFRAASEVKAYLGKGVMTSVRALPAGGVQAEHGVRSAQSVQAHTAQPNGTKAKINAYLAANPNAAGMSINDLMNALRAQGVRAGRTTVAEVLREVKKRTPADPA